MQEVINHATYSDEQIAYMSSLHFINRIDEYLKIVSSVSVVHVTPGAAPRVILLLDIFYHDDKVDTLSFDLHNYSYDEIVELSKNISANEFILQEVDNFLGGDVVE